MKTVCAFSIHAGGSQGTNRHCIVRVADQVVLWVLINTSGRIDWGYLTVPYLDEAAYLPVHGVPEARGLTHCILRYCVTKSHRR